MCGDYAVFLIFDWMDKKVFDKDKMIKYWIDDSEDDYDTMIIKQVLS